MENNIYGCNHNNIWTSIQGCCYCSHPQDDVWMKQQGYKHLESSNQQTCLGFVPFFVFQMTNWMQTWQQVAIKKPNISANTITNIWCG